MDKCPETLQEALQAAMDGRWGDIDVWLAAREHPLLQAHMRLDGEGHPFLMLHRPQRSLTCNEDGFQRWVQANTWWETSGDPITTAEAAATWILEETP